MGVKSLENKRRSIQVDRNALHTYRYARDRTMTGKFMLVVLTAVTCLTLYWHVQNNLAPGLACASARIETLDTQATYGTIPCRPTYDAALMG